MIGRLEVFEFFVAGKEVNAGHVLLHLAEPSAPHEKERGYFFAIAEIVGGSEDQIQAVQHMIDDIETNYYAEKNRGRDVLERLLAHANRDYADILQYPESTVHCVVGALRPHGLTLAYHGAPLAAVFYPSAHQLEIAPIISEESNGELLFGEVIDGTLNPGDYLYLGSPSVEEYFSSDRVRKIMETKAGRFGSAHIQKVLTDVGSQGAFGGFFFHVTDERTTPKTGALPKTVDAGSEASLNHLAAATKTTEETLSPPFLGDMGQKIKSLGGAAAETEETTGFARVLVGFGRTLVIIGTSLGRALTLLFITVVRGLQNSFAFISNRHHARESMIANWRARRSRSQRFLAELPTSSKLILLLAVVLAVGFISSLIYLRVRENRAAESERHKNLVAAIINKKDAAEARLIYDDKTQAQQLIQEAERLLGELPTSTPAGIAEADKLAAGLAVVREKLDGVKKVAPDQLVDLRATAPDVRTTGLARVGTTLIAYGPEDNKLYSINIATKQVATIPHDTVPGLVAATVPPEEDKIVFITTSTTVAEFDPKTQALLGKTIAYPGAARISAIALYNRKLYTLDAGAGQIYKHNPTAGGYDKGTAWLKQAANLNGASALTIDGDVYVLAGGTIKKFFTGAEQAFAVATPNPAMDKPRQIMTNGNTPELLVLDSTHRRVLVFNKSGTLVTTYTNAAWKNPTGLAIGDGGKTLYILDDNKVFQFKR